MCLACLYSFNTPLFEAPDAYYHFALIEYVARQGRLPSKDDPQAHPWQQMTFHAPLYYLVSAALIVPLSTRDFQASYPRNPHAQIGEPKAEDNQNFVAHSGDPWCNTGLAARVVQFFSLTLGAVTLASIFVLARGVFPARPGLALLAVLVVLLNPQFLFISSVVNNDNLVVALSSVGLAALVWMIRRGVTWQRLAFLAILLALNSLAKASGMTLYPAAAATVLYIGWRDHLPLKTLCAYALIGLLAWALLAGWWYGQNFIQFGDPFATSQIAKASGERTGEVDVVGELRGLYFSFWGLFGWFNIIAPLRFYDWTTLLLGVSVSGLGVGLWGRVRRAVVRNIHSQASPYDDTLQGRIGCRKLKVRFRFSTPPLTPPHGNGEGKKASTRHLLPLSTLERGLGGEVKNLKRTLALSALEGDTRKVYDSIAVNCLLCLYAILVIGAWWHFNTLVTAGQGRLWFPLLGVVACGVAQGLSVWRYKPLSVVLLGGMAVAAIGFPALLIAPAYRPPEQIRSQDWRPPADMAAFELREPWQEKACLRLWVSLPVWKSGDPISLTIAQETLCPLEGYWSRFIHFTDPALETCAPGDTRYILAQQDTMPGGGDLPLPAFRPGHVIIETIRVALPPALDPTRQYHLQLGYYDAGGGSFIRMPVETTPVRQDAMTVARCASNAVNIALP
jgi:4-amino-4-deoxy-L-arabinose transferase-like glycosyltransferase